jgi:arylsulfatase A-like enzyme
MGGILHPMEIVKRLLCRENAAAACLLSALLGCVIGNPGPAFNVVVIVLDTTRADHLGLYGASRAITPRLDELAAESAVFDLAIAQASVTPVSCASLLTGLWPYRHGLRVLHGTSKNRLPPAAVTLAEVWKQAGGRSAAFVSAFPASGAFGLAQGFDVFDAEFGIENAPHISKRGVVTTGMSQRRADVTTDAALDWLERAERDRAFLLWLHYFDPHDTYLTPPREFVARFPPASSSGADALRALYAAEIAFVDSQIGRVIDALRSGGLWDSTVVVVTADHGEGLGDHDWWTHGVLYQEQIRVPLMLRVPGLGAGLRVPSLVRSIDVMPSVLEAAAVERSHWPEMDGESLMGVLRSGRTAGPRIAYSDSVAIGSYPRPDVADAYDRKPDRLYALIDGSYKLIYHQREPRRSEAYDLAADPREERNLWPVQSPEIALLRARLRRLGAFYAPAVPGTAPPADPERVRKLEALGYVE